MVQNSTGPEHPPASDIDAAFLEMADEKQIGNVIRRPLRRSSSSLQRFLVPMLCAVALSLALTASYQIPFNIPGMLIYYRISQFHPELQQTGDAVEIQFAWVTIRQAWVWLLLTGYHLGFFLPASLMIAWARTRRGKREN